MQINKLVQTTREKPSVWLRLANIETKTNDYGTVPYISLAQNKL